MPKMPKVGARVEVFGGDGKTLLGKGRYVGDVTVWYIQSADGNLQSLGNAEEKPGRHLIPKGGKIVRDEGNPKLVLDDGTVKYGCQVWWNTIKED